MHLRQSRIASALVLTLAFALSVSLRAQTTIPDKTVILTFDDAVKTQLTNVAPLLQQLGFKATFFITHNWMGDKANFMTWEDAAKLNSMGFEIGNHTWTHSGFETPEKAATLAAELDQVDRELARVGIPKPVSFAWPGDNFGPEAIAVLQQHGIKFARRGMQPEVAYGEIKVGPALDVTKYSPLLIPTTGDSYPGWTLEHFKQVVARARNGKIAVLQFHGVPDVAHPWVNTPPELFRACMMYLKENGYRTIEMRDLAAYYDQAHLPDDPMLKQRIVANPRK
jgi:peptidoglycan/xylan/chitin deacetylase (PgdA/CDA1 family)